MENGKVDRALRPQSLSGFSGQKQVVENLRVYIAGAKSRGEPLEHLLFCGGPGLGKTTLAGIVAQEMGSKMVTVNAPSIKTKGEMAAILMKMERGDILFLDEIHRLKPEIQELLYPVMEDFKFEVASGNNPVQLDLDPFTIVGATTHEGLLSRPLRDRFGDVCNLQPYTVEELEVVVQRASFEMKITVEPMAARVIAHRSRATPRVALKMLRRMRDYAAFEKKSAITLDMAKAVFQKLGIDACGLDQKSRQLLSLLVEKGKPVGLATLASMLGEQKENLEASVEPHLLAMGLIEKTSGGRTATDKGRKYLSI